MAIAALAVTETGETSAVRRARALGVAVRFALGHAALLAVGAGGLIALGWSLPVVIERDAPMIETLADAEGLRPDRHPRSSVHSHLPTLIGAAFAVSSLRALALLAPFGNRAGAAPLPVLLGLVTVFAAGVLLSMSLFGVAFANLMSARVVGRLGRTAAGTMGLASLMMGTYWMGRPW